MIIIGFKRDKENRMKNITVSGVKVEINEAEQSIGEKWDKEIRGR